MIAFRRYFVFVILVIGTVLADPNFSVDDKMKFYSSILKVHNYFRKMHGAKPLELNKNMYDEATGRINLSAEAITSVTADAYGVNNIVMDIDDKLELCVGLAIRVVAEWYIKARGYNHHVEPSSDDADAFTQMVWKKTTSLVVDLEVKDNKLYITAFYSPAGNKRNEYVKNVGPFKDSQDVILNSDDLEILHFLIHVNKNNQATNP